MSGLLSYERLGQTVGSRDDTGSNEHANKKAEVKTNYVMVEQDVTPSHSPHTSISNQSPSAWLPQSLSRTYLLSLSVLSLLLGVCCLALVAYSQTHDGIANAGSSGGFKFNQRFLPTLVAVLYTLLWAPVVVDVVRTEPWALLSLPAGSKAADSLLQKDKLWWTHLSEAIRNRKRPGGVRWPLFIAVLASMVSSIAINPLSAGLFDTSDFLTSTDRRFNGVSGPDSKLQGSQIGDVTYLRTVTNLLLNVSTSAWTTNQYAVAPFWPAKLDKGSMSASLAQTPQHWQATRDIVSLEMDCKPFTSMRNLTGETGYLSGELVTDDGCAIKTALDDESAAYWAEVNNSTSTTFDRCTNQGYREYIYFLSRNRTSNPLIWETYKGQFYYYAGQACKTNYFTAQVPVNVSITSSRSTISYEESDFLEARRPLPSNQLNVTEFEEKFIRQTGSNHLRPNAGVAYWYSEGSALSNFNGPTIILANSHNYSIESIFGADPRDIVKEAATIKQRYLGEVLLSGFSQMAEANQIQDLAVVVTEQRTRLTMDLGLGITVGLLFIMLAIAAAGLSALVSLSKRPLQMVADPSKPSTAAMCLTDMNTSSTFSDLDKASRKDLKRAIGHRNYVARSGTLIYVDTNSTPSLSESTVSTQTSSKPPLFGRENKGNAKSDWRPFTLKKLSGSMLVLCLACVMAALVAIFVVSLRRPLYQAALIYESDIRLGTISVTKLAPYSIIPTLVAVAFKLWWGTIDSTHRRLAPFLAMAKQPVPRASDAATTSFLETVVVAVTIKALRNKYWLLALVTFGSLMSEVLQISMAALWTREPGTLTIDIDLIKQFEMRTVPHVFENALAPAHREVHLFAYPRITEHLYGGLMYQTNWVYGSLAEIAFGAAQPAWSRDGWSFAPVDLGAVSEHLPKSSTNENSEAGRLGIGVFTNVTFESEGVRGRMECSPMDATWSRWMTEVTDFAELQPLYNDSNTHLPNITSGFELLPEVRVRNFTKLPGAQPTTVAIGQWLHSNYSSNDTRGNPLYTPNNSPNFTILWIEAGSPYRFVSEQVASQYESPPRLIFAQKPVVQAIDCRPIFETAKSRIKVNTESNKIEDVALLETPVPAKDAWADGMSRHFNNQTLYSKFFYPEGSPDLNSLLSFNTTASWAYLFQLALLQACNSPGRITRSIETRTMSDFGDSPFSFVEPDLYSDPYSYAALSLVDYNRTALLNATKLTEVSQRVFSTFFQWFVSTKSGFKDDYWVYQPIGAKLQSGLDFGATESELKGTKTYTMTRETCLRVSKVQTVVTSRRNTTMTYTTTEGSCATRYDYTQTYTTSWASWYIENTWAPKSSSVVASRSSNLLDLASRTTSLLSASTNAVSRTVSATAAPRSSSSTSRASNPTPPSSARVAKRAETTPPATLPSSAPANSPNTIRATLQIPTSTLVISRTALFLSITILAILIIFTVIIYTVQNAQLRLLPRDFDSPASLLAAVYASEELKKWASEEYARSQSKGRSGLSWRKKEKHAAVDDDVRVGMGYFRGRDGKEHWGIEVRETKPLLARNGTEIREVPVQESTPMISGQGWENRI